MSVRLALLLALLFGILVAYLAPLNSTTVGVTLAQGRTYQLPLIALVVGAFVAGAGLALLVGTFRGLRRIYREHRSARRARRVRQVHEIYRRGVEAQLAGRAEEAARTYEEVLRRDPANAEAPNRLGELARRRGDASAALMHHLQALRAEERTETLLAVADVYHGLGRLDDASDTYQRVLQRDRDHLTALRGLRAVAVEGGDWERALEAEERLIRVIPAGERGAEETWLAGIQYERGQSLLAAGQPQAAASRFKDALRARPDFLPASLALGDIHLKSGDSREALRVWERALDSHCAPPLLSRLEQLHRAEGRPTRMVALYQKAGERHPENVAVAFGLGRVYFELAMLDEAAEQFEKLEMRVPELPAIHGYLGAIFERRGQIREAFEEYRRALGFGAGFDWPHRCGACGASHPAWFDRCPSCKSWNTARPS
ncbi:MAG TPA: tetratricopeptide repeat protein [Candidatus Methylomirabilis sp.]|nr:tetratricopeptide repeat protein [Candidatus Methylomirabilis sp.]